MSEVPLIYTRLGGAPRLKIAGRLTAASIALCCFFVLGLAAYLKPSHEGVGTHRAMGFSSCDFMNRTGLPCPTCGMTTSFAWFARGNFLASFYVQPMGFVLAVLTAASAWAALYIAITGKPAHRLMQLLPHRYYLIPLMMFAVASWGWKMFIHTKGFDGW